MSVITAERIWKIVREEGVYEMDENTGVEVVGLSGLPDRPVFINLAALQRVLIRIAEESAGNAT